MSDITNTFLYFISILNIQSFDEPFRYSVLLEKKYLKTHSVVQI
jgi:hypothetical protein